MVSEYKSFYPSLWLDNPKYTSNDTTVWLRIGHDSETGRPSETLTTALDAGSQTGALENGLRAEILPSKPLANNPTNKSKDKQADKDQSIT